MEDLESRYSSSFCYCLYVREFHYYRLKLLHIRLPGHLLDFARSTHTDVKQRV